VHELKPLNIVFLSTWIPEIVFLCRLQIKAVGSFVRNLAGNIFDVLHLLRLVVRAYLRPGSR